MRVPGFRPRMVQVQLRDISPFVLATVLLAGLAGAFFFVRFDYGYIHGDEGYTLEAAWRIVQGQTPNADFFAAIPPVSFLVVAAFFKLFGAHLVTAKLTILVYAILLVVAADRLLCHYTRHWAARCAVIAFLIPYGVYAFPVPGHHWLIAIVQLAAMALLLQAAEQQDNRQVLLLGAGAGSLAAAAVFTMQDQGTYLIVALFVGYFPWISDRQLRRSLFSAWFSGMVLFTLGVCAYLLPWASLRTLAHDWVIFPATRYYLLEAHTFDLTKLHLDRIVSPQWRENLARFPDLLAPAFLLDLLMALLPLLVAAIVLQALRRRWSSVDRVGLLGAGAASFFAAALHNYSLVYLYWAAPSMVVVVAWGLGWLAEKGTAALRRLALGLLLGWIGLSTLVAIGHLRQISATATVSVSGPAGTLRVPADSTQSSMQLIIDAIEQHVPPGAPLFCTEYNPIINFWTQRPNPTPFDTFIYPRFHTEKQADQVIAALRASPEALVFLPLEPGNRLHVFLRSDYQVIWRGPWALLLKTG